MRRLMTIAIKTLPPILICVWATAHGGLPVPDGFELQISTDPAHQKSQVALAAHPDGRMIAAWTSNGQDGNGLGIFARRYNADGNPAGGESSNARRMNSASQGRRPKPEDVIRRPGSHRLNTC